VPTKNLTIKSEDVIVYLDTTTTQPTFASQDAEKQNNTMARNASANPDTVSSTKSVLTVQQTLLPTHQEQAVCVLQKDLFSIQQLSNAKPALSTQATTTMTQNAFVIPDINKMGTTVLQFAKSMKNLTPKQTHANANMDF